MLRVHSLRSCHSTVVWRRQYIREGLTRSARYFLEMLGNSRAARTGREQEAKENQSTPKLAKVPGLELSRL